MTYIRYEYRTAAQMDKMPDRKCWRFTPARRQQWIEEAISLANEGQLANTTSFLHNWFKPERYKRWDDPHTATNLNLKWAIIDTLDGYGVTPSDEEMAEAFAVWQRVADSHRLGWICLCEGIVKCIPSNIMFCASCGRKLPEYKLIAIINNTTPVEITLDAAKAAWSRVLAKKVAQSNPK